MRQITFFTALLLHVTIRVVEGQINNTLNAILRRALDDAVNTVQPQTARPRIVGQAGQAAPQPSVPTGNSPQDLLNLFGGQTEDPQASSANSVSGQLFRVFRQNVARSGEVFGSRAVQDELPFLAADIRQKCILPLRPVCVDGYPYRYPDGSCNNPNPNILRGAAQTAQPRFVEAEYEQDSIFDDLPRTHGKNGEKLKSARVISNAVLSTTPSNRSPKSTRHTLTLVHFAQFVDHDVIKTPATKIRAPLPNDPYHEIQVRDCNKHCVIPKEHCFPIEVPDNNFVEDCMHFVRNKPAPGEDCMPKTREQLNERTSFLDLSSTYGSSERRLVDLRQFINGRLNASSDNLLPDGPPNDDCLPTQICFISGDDRFQEIPMLTVIHINFLREHNRIAEKLHKINPHWKDEKLFQEARKILTGIYQHIVYNEFIPLLVGKYTALGSNLLSTSTGHRNSYNRFIDPGTHNGFGVAAYRFGHSLVGRFTRALEPNFTEKTSNELRFDFFNNVKIRDSTIGPTRIGRWMADMVMRKRDKFISDQVRNHLFETKFTFPSDGFDLAAFNIQRGRDHGIPGYNKFREFCGLYAATMFNNGPMGFRDHDYDTVQKLESMYSHPDDVDLFVGGISEKPNLNGDILGPTFKCLIAQQFQRYKEGDRFFYENPFKDTGFTVKQLNDIKKQTFAGIFCRSLKLAVIQRKVFEKESYKNPRVKCDKVPEPNLYLWKERKGYFKH
uniref:Byssal peroxidase-like protein 4 n=1 Tax=Mytilus coruscus TaxID=42192 RepID=A0A193DUA3_MYTCO|nr:byssal peroxidase-like protein 4 [Mytilus coruscus]